MPSLGWERAYRSGMQGLAYEIVINSNPCIAYLMEENSIMMQALVVAHAAYGHNSFFKGNHLFRQWTCADGILDFKLALPRNKLDQGEFHDKFGIFTDSEGNQVSFNGSYNDSIQGTRNYESIKVFCSWQAPFSAFVQADVNRFQRLWDNQDPNVRVFALPDAARE